VAVVVSFLNGQRTHTEVASTWKHFDPVLFTREPKDTQVEAIKF